MSHDHNGTSLEEFRKYREKMNHKILEQGNLQIKRFFNLDSQAYEDGVLPKKTKELLGLVSSMVLRCDDCITYHIIQCADVGVTDAEFFEVFNIGLVVGGSIVIPHLRRAVETLEECRTATGMKRETSRSGHDSNSKPSGEIKKNESCQCSLMEQAGQSPESE